MDELPANFPSYRIELIVAFSLTLFLFLVEIIGFTSGLSMFSGAQNLLCILFTKFTMFNHLLK